MSEDGNEMARGRPPPPAAAMEDDDLLSEILLRLPPLPSSLPRASLVCTRWRRLLTDPQFLGRFCAHHHRNPPLLGFFLNSMPKPTFTPTLPSPDRVPEARFSLDQLHGSDTHHCLGCRHGRALFVQWCSDRLGYLVWDPVTGERSAVSIPPEFYSGNENFISNGTVLCPAHHQGHSIPFQVVMIGTDRLPTQVFACVYSSETGKWGDTVSAPVRSIVDSSCSSTLVEGSLYWLLAGGDTGGILQFDLIRQRLVVIDLPPDVDDTGDDSIRIMQAYGGGLGVLHLLDYNAQLWKMMTGCDGSTRWVLGKIIELDKLLSLRSQDEEPFILGYDDNTTIVWAGGNAFMIDFGSMQFERLPESILRVDCYPFTSFYTAGF